jgi:uncharacterized protein (DUF1015 family)
MTDLASPPYDVISSEERLRLAARHPRNVVRLILPGEAGKAEDGTFYEGAASLLSRWQQEGTLERDPGPAFYAYRQIFQGPDGREAARLGFLGALALPGQSERGSVLPHEKTLAGPRHDRTRLMLACRANLSPIFLLHPDATGAAGKVLQEAARRHPLFRFKDSGGVSHEMWKLDTPDFTQPLEEALASDWTLIADGHHRYESALAVRDQLPEVEGAGFVLAFFCSLGDPGFRIFPIHRLLRSRDEEKSSALAQLMQGDREVTRLPADLSPEAMVRRLGETGEHHVAVVPRDGHPFILALTRPEEPATDPLMDFDTILLQRKVFTGVFGLTDQDIAAGAVGYTADAAEAIRQVRSGEATAAFLLNALKVDAVVRAAQAGLVLPQKSTYFYPKVYTGLVIRPF